MIANSNFYGKSSGDTLDSVELIFDVYSIEHYWTNPFDFGECRIYSFLQKFKKEFLYTTINGVKFLKACECLNGAFIELKFGTCITSHRPVYCIDFV